MELATRIRFGNGPWRKSEQRRRVLTFSSVSIMSYSVRPDDSSSGDSGGMDRQYRACCGQILIQAAQARQSRGRASHGPQGVADRQRVGQIVTHSPHAVQRRLSRAGHCCTTAAREIMARPRLLDRSVRGHPYDPKRRRNYARARRLAGKRPRSEPDRHPLSAG